MVDCPQILSARGMEELGTLSGLHRSHTSKATAAAEVQEEKVDKLVIKFLHTDGDFGNY